MARVKEPIIENSEAINWRNVRLTDELDKFIKMVSHCRQALENELMSGFGAKAMGIGEKDMRRLRDLASVIGSAVDAKIRYDKAQKAMQISMTPEEEFEAVVGYVRAMEPDTYATFCNRVYRNKNRSQGSYGPPDESEDSGS